MVAINTRTQEEHDLLMQFYKHLGWVSVWQTDPEDFNSFKRYKELTCIMFADSFCNGTYCNFQADGMSILPFQDFKNIIETISDYEWPEPPSFKEGDWVKVVRKVECYYWVDGMDKQIGNVLKVINFNQSAGLTDGYYYPPEALEHAEPPTQEDKRKRLVKTLEEFIAKLESLKNG